MLRRLVFTLVCTPLLALPALGCSAQTLDAGSNLAPPATRALLAAAVDAMTMDDANLYLACEDGFVYRIAKAGTAPPVPIAPAPVAGSSFVDGIAVDEDNVYWTAQGSATASTGGAVLSAPKGATNGTAHALATARTMPWGIAVDDDSVYWAERGGTNDPVDDGVPGDLGSLQVMPKSGGAPKPLAVALDTPDFVALDGDGVVWHDATVVARVPKAGGPPVELLSTASPSKLSNLVVSAGNAYWALDEGSWSIASASTSGGGSATLASDVPQPSAVAVSGGAVLWSLAGGPQVGAVFQVPMAGGTPSNVTPPDVQPAVQDEQVTFLLVDAQAFYFVETWQTSGAAVVALRIQPR